MTDETPMTATEVLIRQAIAPTERRVAQLRGEVSHVMSRMDNIEPPPTPDRAELYKALAAAQLEIRNAEENVENEFLHSKYADLASVLNAVREPLAKNGIALFQCTADPGQGVLGIRTVLAHESGQSIEDVITMAPPKTDPQGVGSCRTYMRRYAIMAMCGIAGAADDDAERTKLGPDEYERITAAEAEQIHIRADELCGNRADEVVARMLKGIFGGISTISDIKAGEAEVAMTAIKNAADLMAKKAKEGTKKIKPQAE